MNYRIEGKAKGDLIALGYAETFAQAFAIANDYLDEDTIEEAEIINIDEATAKAFANA